MLLSPALTKVLLSLHLVFFQQALDDGVDPAILEGICRFESDNGRVKRHHNRNGTWDVGYCMNHRGVSKRPPRVPTPKASIEEAAEELAYWKRHHEKYCVKTLERKNRCGAVFAGKWRGVKNCRKPHPYYAHYNWGFRVLRNGYDKRVKCFITNDFQRCTRKKWQKISF